MEPPDTLLPDAVIAGTEPFLVVGAMVVGPEFGPVAGLCVALVQRRPTEARRSLTALLVVAVIGLYLPFFGGSRGATCGLLAATVNAVLKLARRRSSEENAQ